MPDEKRTYNINEIVISLCSVIITAIFFLVTGLYNSPILLFIVIIILLYPFRQFQIVKISVWVLSIIFILWFINSVFQLLIPFIFAFALSYMLNPLVEKLNRKNISRTWASLIIILSFIISIVALILFLAPLIVAQFTELISSLPNAVNDVNKWINTVFLPWLDTIGIPSKNLQEKLLNQLPSNLEQILNNLMNSLSAIFSGLSVVLNQIINLILIPFLTFYILKDFDELKLLVKKLLPQKRLEIYVDYYHRIDELLGSFMRGSLIAALIHGVGVFIFLTIIGVKYAIFLSAFSALVNLIPYFGVIISIVLTAIVALFSGNPALQVPLSILFYLLQNLLETSYIIPKIVGEKLGLHPAILILSLMIFAYFFGFIGLLIAMPVTSILIMFLKDWLDKRKIPQSS
jgi:predicted PurR-regulated permease PerM